MIKIAEPHLSGYKPGDRQIYRKIFAPIIKPDFMFTKLMAQYPMEGEELDSYSVGKNTEVLIFKLPTSVRPLSKKLKRLGTIDKSIKRRVMFFLIANYLLDLGEKILDIVDLYFALDGLV